MVLGKVVGRVSSVQKLPTLKGLPMVIVQRLSSEGKIRGDDMTIAIDPLGVGMGQTFGFAPTNIRRMYIQCQYA